jgi:4-amino-4-deoxy-L-arabinose transferase-like glycosyltransferase
MACGFAMSFAEKRVVNLTVVNLTWQRLGLIALTLAAFAWRMQGLTWQSLWRDEVDAILFATRDLTETLRMFVQPGQNGALYFVSLRPWFDLVGTSEFALRYPSAMAGTLSVLLTWQVARRLLPLTPFASPHGAVVTTGASSAMVAWLSAALMALNPYQLWYAQEGKMYTAITMLVLLATWWWLEGIRRGGWQPWLAYLITVSVAMYTHLLLILLFPVHFVWFLLAWPASKHHWRGYALALAGLTLPYLPMVWWHWALLTTDIKRTGFSFTPPVEMARTLIYNHSRGFMPPEDVMWLLPVFFLCAAGIVLGMGEIAAQSQVGDAPGDRPDPVSDPVPEQAHERAALLHLAAWRRWSLTLAWLLLPVAGIYAISLRQPIFTDRYVIWIAPALMMLVALGLVVVRRYAWILGRLLAVALLLYVVSFWGYAGWQQKSKQTKYDLRGAVSYLAEARTPGSLLILQIPHMEWAYRYYTSDFGPRPFAESEARLAPWMGGMWTNQGWPDELARADVAYQMSSQTAAYTDVWVLRSEVEMWDQRHLMDQWLDENGTLLVQENFHGAQVRHYQLPGQ